MEKRLKKIAVTGPESTGKSTLSEALAEEFGCPSVPEFARKYLHGRTPPYKESDLIAIAKGQWQSEQEAILNAAGLIIADTEMTVMKIWCEHAFGKCLPLIQQYWEIQEYDLYLLTDIDLPWGPDPLREHPDLRQYFFHLYKNLLEERKVNYAVISGVGEERLANARIEIKKMLAEG